MKAIFISLIFLLLNIVCIAQNIIDSNNTTTTYFHINTPNDNRDNYRNGKLTIGFILTNLDTTGKPNWHSEIIKDFEIDSAGYFLKANIPAAVVNNSGKMWCTSIILKYKASSVDTLKTKYGGVQISRIKLILKSTPEGAETFLIPNRIWMAQFENADLFKNNEQLQKFRVNTSSTNTYAYVDQPVFVVVYKMNNKFKTVLHQTKPFSIEQEQTIWTQL